MLASLGLWEKRTSAPVEVILPPSLVVDDPDREVGGLEVGQPLAVSFRIGNSATTPRRVVGVHATCGPSGCFLPVSPEQLDIPPADEVDYRCELKITKAGPFDCRMELFLDDGGLRQVTLRVRGVGVAVNPDAPPKQ